MSPSPSSSSSHSPSPSSAFPHTPDSDFSPVPVPAIASPDEFALQLDLQLDKMIASPSTVHLPPQPTDPRDDASKVRVLLRNADRWGSAHDWFESSPSSPQDGASDGFSWDTTCPPPEPSRYSLLIHEVSLLVGLTAEDGHVSAHDGRPLPDPSRQVHDILPLNLTPTKSLAARKHRNANAPVCSSDVSVSPGISPHAGSANLSLYDQGHPPVGPRDPATPIPRHKSADVARPSLSPRRRQGQVFHVDPSLSNVSRRNAVDLDEMFSYPRKPPPKPTRNPPSNRCSSLDRLECSLLKLEAYAPTNHRKSRSDGRPSDHVVQEHIRPSLPPSPCRRRLQSSHEVMDHNRRPARHFLDPPPAAKSIPPHRYVALRSCPAVPLDDDPREEPTPTSFMDMDIPLTEEARPKRQGSFRRPKSREKVKSLASVAKRVSRGVIAWGKNLTGSTKPAAADARA